MASTTLEPPKAPAVKKKLPRPWWGTGPAPHRRWPGVTLDFQAEWSTLRRRWETHQGRYYFEPAKADRAADFFPMFLQHHIGEFDGLPFDLRDDQKHLIVRPLFGWRRAEDGLRRFRKLFAFCPKGYGKSPLGAGLGLYLARFDGEAAAEVYAVAADRDQGRIVHDNAKVMVEGSPELYAGASILKNAIIWPDLHARYMVLSADASTKHGFRPHGVIFDELHAQKNRDLYEALRKSMAKRAQPLLLIITHAGSDDEGICYEEYDLARRVLSGNAELESTLPVIFEIQKGQAWNDPAVWPLINPGHGVTVKHDQVLEECREAEAEPRKRNDFVRFHCNQWTNQATAWIPIEWWDACAVPALMDDDHLRTLDCAAGLDLAQKWDLAACCVVFREYLQTAEPLEVLAENEETGQIEKKTVALNYKLYVRPFFWIPEDTLRQHEKEDGVPYGLWVEQGLVTATEGAVIDYTRIYADLTETIVPRFPKLRQRTIGYDPAFATDLATNLRDKAGLHVVEILQNYKMLSEPSHVMEALIKGRRVVHDGHALLRWNWTNVSVKTDDAGRLRPVKPKNAAKRIDGAIAMIMADKVLSLEAPTPEPQYQMFVFGGPSRGRR